VTAAERAAGTLTVGMRDPVPRCRTDVGQLAPLGRRRGGRRREAWRP
jgi:hypothetical protein